MAPVIKKGVLKSYPSDVNTQPRSAMPEKSQPKSVDSESSQVALNLKKPAPAGKRTYAKPLIRKFGNLRQITASY
jgi:hypothetical protein